MPAALAFSVIGKQYQRHGYTLDVYTFRSAFTS
jgi:hypothetical protein